jgi:sugar lactone lactonase YvrE
MTIGDLDGDRLGEVFVAAADGTVHVFDRTGAEVGLITLPRSGVGPRDR